MCLYQEYHQEVRKVVGGGSTQVRLVKLDTFTILWGGSEHTMKSNP